MGQDHQTIILPENHMLLYHIIVVYYALHMTAAGLFANLSTAAVIVKNELLHL